MVTPADDSLEGALVNRLQPVPEDERPTLSSDFYARLLWRPDCELHENCIGCGRCEY